MPKSNENGNRTKVTPTDLFTGKTLGNFRIVSKIGHGGMGLVYKAYDRTLDRIVALKILPPHLQDDEFTKRFVREARTSAKLDHPNVVQIYSVGRSQNTWYIAMQHVKGKTLADYLTQGYRFSFKQTLIITRAVANALGAAHRLGIIHRDIKPSNIMIDEQGRVKVMDFGLARLMLSKGKFTQTGTYLGTPEYSSPEQCESGQVDGRSDIYSLGVVLYELLSGRVPHIAETPLALFNKITSETPIPLKDINHSVPPSIERLVEKMLAKKQEDRLQNARETARAIDRLLHTERLPAQIIDKPARVMIDEKITPVKPRLISNFKKTASPLVISAVVGAGLILIGFIILVIHLSKPPAETTIITPPIDMTAVTPPAIVEETTMIVFDFINQTGNKDAPWLEIALADMLIANFNLDQNYKIKAIPRYDLLTKMKQLGKKITLDTESDERITMTPASNTLIKSFKAHLIVRGTFYITEGNKIRIITDLYRYYADKNDEPLKHINRTMTQSDNYNQDLFKLVDEISDKLMGTLVTEAENYDLRIAGLSLENSETEKRDNIKDLVAHFINDTLNQPENLERELSTGKRGRYLAKANSKTLGKAYKKSGNGETKLKQDAKAEAAEAGPGTPSDAKLLQSGSPDDETIARQTLRRAESPDKGMIAEQIIIQKEHDGAKKEKDLDQRNAEELSRATSRLSNNFQAQLHLAGNKELNSLLNNIKRQQADPQSMMESNDKDAARSKLADREEKEWAQEELPRNAPAAPEALTETIELAETQTLSKTTKTKSLILDATIMKLTEIDEVTLNKLLQLIYQNIMKEETETFKEIK